MSDLQASIVAGVAAALLGYLTPLLVRRIPEPPPSAEAELTERERAEGPKQTYAAIAALGWFAPTALAVSGGAGALVGASLGWSWLLVGLVPLAPVVVALSIVDLRTKLLPALVVVPATLVLLGLAVLHATTAGDPSDLLRAVAAMLLGRSFYWLLWRINSAGMGFGDVRLSALLGLALGYLGWPQLVVGLYAGFLLLGVPGLVLVLVRRDRAALKAQLPFGPFMGAGALVGIVLGQPLLAGLVSG